MKSLNELFEKKENRSLEIIAKEILEGLYHGKHKSPFHGFSSEFKEYTHFQTGDNPRQIDWKLFGKTEKLYKKRLQDERNIQAIFVLDTSSSMYFPVENSLKMEKAIQWIAVMCHILYQQHDSFGLVLINENAYIETPLSNTKHNLQSILAQLETFRTLPQKPDSSKFSAIFSNLMESLGTRKMVFILSDLLFPQEDYQEFVNSCLSLAFRKNQLTIMRVFHESEIYMKNKSPEKMLTFMDVETKENVQISTDQLNDTLKHLNLQIEEQIIYSLLQKGVKSKSFDSEKPIVQLIKETI